MKDKGEGGDLVLQSQRKDIDLLCIITTVCYDQMPRLLFFLVFALVQLLSEGSVHFIGNPVDRNDG